ncbi:hypothetical protein [Micromonospora deserti]|uniref:Uncharacterized protein n=1 Tax=Micromonospora deserti TaxID=2070366 RepID=A0A2W2CLS4_9ACTN|nr:hypothetical protein [Micromonospora deserti]PZF89067.1 hypothetical protein C1I99_25780 [Micromonospora deserti]
MNRLSSTVLVGALALAVVVPAVHPAPASAAGRPATAQVAGAAGAGLRAAPAGPARDAGGAMPGHRDFAADPAGAVDLLSVRGAGPFRIGASLVRLSAAGLIDWTVAECDGVVRAGVTGEWAGVILLAFRHGRLVEVGTATAPPRSPAGAAVGMSFFELAEIYGRRGALIRNDAGDASAYLVRFGSRVELFTGHPIRPGVGYFQVGPADFVERAFRQGRSC